MRLRSNDPAWDELDDCADESFPTESRRFPRQDQPDELDREVRDRLELNDATVDQECAS